ncbi:MAG: AI-2E family transporter [Sporichthyaceae bacterium]
MIGRRRPRQATDAPPVVVAAPATPPDGVTVPFLLRFAAAWSWRLLVVAAFLYVVLRLSALLSVVLVPVIVGLLLCAVASPIVDRLQRWMPRSLATALVVVTGLVVLVALVALVAQQLSAGFGDLRASFDSSLVKLEKYLTDLGLQRAQVRSFFDRVQAGVGGAGGGNISGKLLAATTTAGHLVAGIFIALFSTIFFTYDGRGIWSWMVGLFPARARGRVHGSGERAWAVLTSYVRATMVIAATDALGIGLVALILGVPFVLPIVVLVFLGAFIPVVGATISGIAAVAVALVDGGPVVALIMLAGVIAVQQIESHVLQPFLMGRLVRVHPLAVVLAIATGTVVAGIFGALIAVPLVAIVNVVGGYLAGEREPLDTPDFGAAADHAVTR